MLLLLPLVDVPLVDDVELFGVAWVAALRGASEDATTFAAGVPDAAIEFSCDTLIKPFPHSM